MLNTGLGKAASPETVQNKIDHSLLGTGNARSVAQPIAFLVGPEADHINGTVVRIDGGLRY
jgi:NAD(P)-dependent dehydrogenase (short-subunit alcohol dehydrogenase family)